MKTVSFRDKNNNTVTRVIDQGKTVLDIRENESGCFVVGEIDNYNFCLFSNEFSLKESLEILKHM